MKADWRKATMHSNTLSKVLEDYHFPTLQKPQTPFIPQYIPPSLAKGILSLLPLLPCDGRFLALLSSQYFWHHLQHYGRKFREKTSTVQPELRYQLYSAYRIFWKQRHTSF